MLTAAAGEPLASRAGRALWCSWGRRVSRRDYAQGLREKKLAQENLDKVDKLKPIAEKLGVPLAQLALAWRAARPHPPALGCEQAPAAWRRRGLEYACCHCCLRVCEDAQYVTCLVMFGSAWSAHRPPNALLTFDKGTCPGGAAA